MTRAVVLGGGMVGATIAADLASDPSFQVTVVEARPARLQQLAATGLVTRQADLSDPATVRAVAADFDLVVGALPSVFGLQTLRAVIEAGRNYVDISFMPDDPLPLGELAVQRGVIAVVDCGVAPGVSNMMAGRAAAELDPCERIDMCVGGLPVVRQWPFEYKAGFAPSDVLEEYTRPARLVEHGKLVVREALSEPELLELPGVGTVEAFNTDGLRSLIFTLKVPTMRERTLRWPGHIELMRVFRDLGLFSKEPIEVKGVRVVPLEITSALLFPKWTFGEGEADLTVMRVEAHGRKDGHPTTMRWDLFDQYDPATGTRSMSRSTAFPATLVARMIAGGRFPLGPGVHPPEIPAQQPGFLDEVLAGLRQRGVHIEYDETHA
ncbi:MAG TPA: FAD-dependent oxidoreductase [Kofleriaceae bacterium]|jgi:saccharopine dehydrogenase-like NADP-dependent oxidoreductase|nr:FAD-dependent oxidoreductase [Kofleriaceae bacterium]